MIIGNPMIFRQMPLEDAIRRMGDLGYEALELWPPQIEACRTAALRERLARFVERLGLKLIRLNAADRSYFQALDMLNDASDDSIIAGLCTDIDLAIDLGMDQLLTWEGRVPSSAQRQDRFGTVLKRTVEIFRCALRHAEAAGVSMSVEVHPFTLGIDLDWLLQLCEDVNTASFGVTYDCCHFGVGLPKQYADAIRRIGRHLHHVHYADSDTVSSEVHFAPGTGILNLQAIHAALADIQFSGSVMLDLWLDPLPDEGTRRGIPQIRELLTYLKNSSRNGGA